MPQYAPELVDYLEELGEDGAPTKALSDPRLLQRCLSRKAPLVLVGRVAAGLEDVDSHPDITALSTYERGRVMTALGRSEEAARLYEQALNENPDRETRGFLLVNFANEQQSPHIREALFRFAIAEGYDHAFANLGLFLYGQERKDQAIAVLHEGVQRGVPECVPILGDIFASLGDKALQNRAIEALYHAAQSAGIPDVVEAPFDQFATRLLVRLGAGQKPLNALAHQRPLLRANRPSADGDR